MAAAQGLLRPGMVIAADKGLAGRQFQGWMAGLDAVLVRPDCAMSHAGWTTWAESASD